MMRSKKILFFVPNLICYFRFILLLICLVIFREHPFITVSLLFICEYLDMIDGYTALRLQQCSNFGAVLDYIIDRLYYIVLAILLISEYPQALLFFSLILMLDIASHMARIYTALYSGAGHHKAVLSSYKLLQLYYAPSRNFMRLTILSYDAFLLLLFLNVFLDTSVLLWIVLLLTLPGFLTKVAIHFLQLIECVAQLLSSETNSSL